MSNEIFEPVNETPIKDNEENFKSEKKGEKDLPENTEKIEPKKESTEEMRSRLQKELESLENNYGQISQKNKDINEKLKNIGMNIDFLGESAKEEEILKKSIEDIQSQIKDLEKNKEEKTETENIKKEENISTQEIERELEELPENERNKIEIGGHNIGFAMEKTKAKIFAGLTGFASKFAPEGGTVDKFLKSLSETYKNDADLQERKMSNAESEEGKKLLKTSNRLKAASNILKVASYIGNGPAMTISSVFSRGMETAKKMRLGSEEVLDKTRINDENEAAEEAWKLYEEAKKSPEGKPSKIDLQRTYEKNIPKDVLERLSQNKGENVAQSFLLKMMRKPMEFSAKRLDKKIQAIENNPKIKPEEKEARKNKLLDTYSRALNDLDGIVSKTGEVDTIAAGYKYAEIAGKAIMGGVMAKTVYDGLETVWNKMADVFSELDTEEISEVVSESDVGSEGTETFNKFKKWREELGAENVFSDDELEKQEIIAGRDDKAYEFFEKKAKLRLLDEFSKEYAKQGEFSSWVEDGKEHMVAENNGVRYEYTLNEEGNVVDEKVSGRVEGAKWNESEKKWIAEDKNNFDTKADFGSRNAENYNNSESVSDNFKKELKNRTINSGSGADEDAF